MSRKLKLSAVNVMLKENKYNGYCIINFIRYISFMACGLLVFKIFLDCGVTVRTINLLDIHYKNFLNMDFNFS